MIREVCSERDAQSSCCCGYVETLRAVGVQGCLKVKKIDKQKISGELKLYIYSDKQVNTFPLGDDENYLSKEALFVIDAYFEDVDLEYK